MIKILFILLGLALAGLSLFVGLFRSERKKRRRAEENFEIERENSGKLVQAVGYYNEFSRKKGRIESKKRKVVQKLKRAKDEKEIQTIVSESIRGWNTGVHDSSESAESETSSSAGSSGEA